MTSKRRYYISKWLKWLQLPFTVAFHLMLILLEPNHIRGQRRFSQHFCSVLIRFLVFIQTSIFLFFLKNHPATDLQIISRIPGQNYGILELGSFFTRIKFKNNFGRQMPSNILNVDSMTAMLRELMSHEWQCHIFQNIYRKFKDPTWQELI